ncbi:hypothetical protein OAB29_02635 [Oceanospirillaceae bacterium]|nr:hypothetical protein [Oceanospirillaceae bacterium]
MDNWVMTNTCLSLAQRSLKAAELQMERVWSPPNIKPNCTSEMIEANEHKLIEIHFYFVAMRNIHRFLDKTIKGDSIFESYKLHFEELNEKWFKHNSKGREAFEHIDQRLPGEKHENKLVEIGNRKIHYGIRWSAGEFAHSNLVWDISVITFGTFKTEISSFIEELKNESSR